MSCNCQPQLCHVLTHSFERKKAAKGRRKIKIGRDARTGRFIPVAEAERRPSTTTIETIPHAPRRKRRRRAR